MSLKFEHIKKGVIFEFRGYDGEGCHLEGEGSFWRKTSKYSAENLNSGINHCIRHSPEMRITDERNLINK